ncbi:MAG TPA: hypothetical protein VGZ47_03215 [Gemmataceae bacterium]|nr:hypothetical protein [Gemmataceae bacterium]
MTRVSKQLRKWFGGSRTTTKTRRTTRPSLERLDGRLLPSANMLWGEGVLAGHLEAMAIDSNYNIDYAQDRKGQAAGFFGTGVRGYEVALGSYPGSGDEFWVLDMTGHVMHFSASNGWTETNSPQVSLIIGGHGKVFAADQAGNLWQLNDGASSSWHVIPGLQVYGNTHRMSYIQSGANGAESLFVERNTDKEVFNYNPAIGTWTDTGASGIFDLTATRFGAIGVDKNGYVTTFETNSWIPSGSTDPMWTENISSGFQVAPDTGIVWYLDRNDQLVEVNLTSNGDGFIFAWPGYYYNFIQAGSGGLIFGLQTGGGTNSLFALNTNSRNPTQTFMGSSAWASNNYFSAGTGLDGGPELWEVTTNSYGDDMLYQRSNLQSNPSGNQYFVGYLYYNWFMHNPLPIRLW